MFIVLSDKVLRRELARVRTRERAEEVLAELAPNHTTEELFIEEI